MSRRICLSAPPTYLDAHSQKRARTTRLCHALALTWDPLAVPPACAGNPRSLPPGDTLRCKRPLVGSGISTGCPSPTTFVLGLGPTNPERTSLAQETLGIRRVGFSPTFRYSCRHSHFRPLQPSSRSTFTAERNAPLPRPRRRTGEHIRSFGTRLEPR